MKKIIVYWSGTGNTESIANKISNETGANLKFVNDANVEEVLDNDIIILGCPAMGGEELEDMEFKPFYDELISQVSSQKIYLFGSYDWGDGEWMRLWEEDVVKNGGNLALAGLKVNGDVSVAVQSELDEFINSING